MYVMLYLADVEVNDLLVNASELMTELSTNFSIPYETMESLLSAQINLTEVQKESIIAFKLFLQMLC